MRNPIAKFNRRVNRPAVQADRKKAAKRGYRKHPAKNMFDICRT